MEFTFRKITRRRNWCELLRGRCYTLHLISVLSVIPMRNGSVLNLTEENKKQFLIPG